MDVITKECYWCRNVYIVSCKDKQELYICPKCDKAIRNKKSRPASARRKTKI